MKNIYCLFCLVLAFLTNLNAEKIVTTQITDDTSNHIELIFPNDWDIELQNNVSNKLNIYDNNSPCKLIIVGVKKSTDVPHKVWRDVREKMIDKIFSDFDSEMKIYCQPTQLGQKIVYPGLTPVIYEKTANYLCDDDQDIAGSVHFIETEEHVVCYGLVLLDFPKEQELHARIQAYANCIHIVPNQVPVP